MNFAFIFDSVGGGEWLVLLVVIFVVVGPKNLPSMLRNIGNITAKLRRAAEEFKRQIMAMDEEVRKVTQNFTDEIEKGVSDLEDDNKDSSDLASTQSQYEGYDDGAYPGHDPYEGVDEVEEMYDYPEEETGNTSSEQTEVAQKEETSKSETKFDPDNAVVKITVAGPSKN